ncbi:hypothetical protein J3459_013902 [Metarhizium acridum]|nr:hypothetical protein J3459_013902 [Metarhizium acridum]
MLGRSAFATTLLNHTQHSPTNVTSYPTSVGHAVSDLSRTLKFYHDLLGLEILSQDSTPKVDHAYGQLTASNAVAYKTGILAIPNQSWTLKLTQYIGDNITQVVKQREQDPGAPGLTLSVKNATQVNNALRGANATTLNGQPVPEGTGEGTTSTVWVYDPDGYMVELVQRSGPSDYFTVSAPNITNGPGMKYVIRGQLDLTMANVSQALSFYRDILGQNLSAGYEPLVGPNEHAEVGGIGSVFNISSNVLWAAVTGNCDLDTRCEYFEYDDPTRRTIAYPAQVPGIGMTTYSVRNLNKLLRQVRSANLTVVTKGGSPVHIDGGSSILIRDPTGYLVRLDEKC